MSVPSSPMNCIVLSGWVSRAGVMKRSAQGNLYLKFGLGFIEKRRDSSTGDVVDNSSFIDCVMYGERVKGIADGLTKNRRIGVQGRLSWDKFVDAKKSEGAGRHQILVDRLDFDSFCEDRPTTAGGAS